MVVLAQVFKEHNSGVFSIKILAGSISFFLDHGNEGWKGRSFDFLTSYVEASGLRTEIFGFLVSRVLVSFPL